MSLDAELLFVGFKFVGFQVWVDKSHIDYVWEKCWIYKKCDSLT
jgi:hypothetical protein